MTGTTPSVDLAALEQRVRLLEDERAIRELILTYGPSADAGLAANAAALWAEDGLYDWDANGAPHVGRAGVDAMLRTDGHLSLIGSGVAHFAGPPLVRLDGDTAIALTYSLIMRREDETRYYLWRVSAVRWDLQRDGDTWLVARRTNRLLDNTRAGLNLFGESLHEMFNEGEQ